MVWFICIIPLYVPTIPAAIASPMPLVCSVPASPGVLPSPGARGVGPAPALLNGDQLVIIEGSRYILDPTYSVPMTAAPIPMYQSQLVKLQLEEPLLILILTGCSEYSFLRLCPFKSKGLGVFGGMFGKFRSVTLGLGLLQGLN